MREILFRGKRKDCKAWEIGSYSKYDFQAGRKHFINGFEYEVYPETVGQFTGLTDKNGKQIYEGDIVKGLFLFGLEVRSVVVFQDGAFGLEWNRGKVKNFSAFTSICNVTYEVIGNIHDNPELLEVDDV